MNREGRTGAPRPRAPIKSLGFLSDRKNAALVAPDGDVAFMAMPMDDPSIFASLLDPQAGHFYFSPAKTWVPAGRRYLPDTNVLETTWRTGTGDAVVRDALLIGPWRETGARNPDHPRVPRDHAADGVFVRTVECTRGFVDWVLYLLPRPDWGRERVAWDWNSDDYSELVGRASGIENEFRVRSDLRLGPEGGAVRAHTRLSKGDTRFVAFAHGAECLPESSEEAVSRVRATAEYWLDKVDKVAIPDHPFAPYIRRSVLVLQGLIYAETGAMAAAASTSLPETPGGSRNWDYRFTWLRDSTFVLWALFALGYREEADDYFAFLMDRIDAGGIQVMFGLRGEKDLTEETLDHLEGYGGARPARCGNGAFTQLQTDVFGSVAVAIDLRVRRHEELTDTSWRVLIAVVEAAVEKWREPDSGMWEIRGTLEHHTASKLWCWAACDRGARLARMIGDKERAARWSAVADEIRSDINEHGIDERGVFVQRYGAKALDASLLLVPLLRFLPADDERVINTVHAIADELTENDLVLRYRVSETPDGFHDDEGAFVICNFWMVDALAMIGEVERARGLYERLLAYTSDLGLLAEEVDRNGAHWGNFPQAFSHLAQITSGLHLIEVEQRDDS